MKYVQHSSIKKKKIKTALRHCFLTTEVGKEPKVQYCTGLVRLEVKGTHLSLEGGKLEGYEGQYCNIY